MWVSLLKEHNFNLVVRGHSDNQAFKNNIFPSNWELTSSRAAACLRYVLEKGGIPATRLKAVGFADSQPLLPNNSAANQMVNRRMEFYFHRPSHSNVVAAGPDGCPAAGGAGMRTVGMRLS